jgi:hypothetical protein
MGLSISLDELHKGCRKALVRCQVYIMLAMLKQLQEINSVKLMVYAQEEPTLADI